MRNYPNHLILNGHVLGLGPGDRTDLGSFDAYSQKVGIEKVILDQLINHEAGITMSIERTFKSLEPYGVTREQVQAQYNNFDWSDHV